MSLFVAALFLPAGRLDWVAGWTFLAAFLAFGLGVSLWMLRHDPALLAERQQAQQKGNVKRWDRVIMSLYSVLLFAMLALAGLDAGRFGWSAMPVAGRVAGWAGFLIAAALIWRVMRENTYLSQMVRIQDDREHRVITTGPYRYVRHPMYVGVILFIVCVPLALGSWWAGIPAGLIAGLFVLRTALEDRTLHDELPGYREYATQVRYRLMPGVW